ncbi:MAG: thiamine pyrophosphate-binding protein [Sphingomicrobium sp.]
MIRVSDYFAQTLKAMGAGPVFMLSGGGMMHLIDAVGEAGLPYICCHHEQAGAMEAEGVARATGRLGVCYATSGPGATNVLTGLVGAWQDSSPVLFLTGQSKRSQTIRSAPVPGLRQFGTFEVDIVPIVESVTKFAHFLNDPEDARFIFEKALHLATTGRPGPVLIDVPLDVQGALIDPDKLRAYVPEIPSPPPPTREQLDRVAEKVATAQRPVLLIGHGVRAAGAVPQLRQLIRKLGIPVVTTQLAKDAIAYADPLFVGHCGPKGDRPGNFALQCADLIISIGSSLHAQSIGYECELFATKAFKIQVDVDYPVLKRGDVTVDLQIHSDVRGFIESMLELSLTSIAGGDWPQTCAGWKRRFAVSAEPHDISTPELNYYEVSDSLSALLTGNEIIVTDAGSAFYVLGQAYQVKEDQRYIVSGAMGSMGYALPAAIGAAAACPDRRVICVTGDGSVQSNIHELQVLRHHGFDLKLIVVDNDGYISIRNTQNAFFQGNLVGCSRDSGVSMPPLEKLAYAYDLPFVWIDQRDDLRGSLEAALSTPGPMVIGIKGQPVQSIIPTVSSRRLANGGLRSNPLHIMHPELPEAVLRAELGPYLGDSAIG